MCSQWVHLSKDSKTISFGDSKWKVGPSGCKIPHFWTEMNEYSNFEISNPDTLQPGFHPGCWYKNKLYILHEYGCIITFDPRTRKIEKEIDVYNEWHGEISTEEFCIVTKEGIRFIGFWLQDHCYSPEKKDFVKVASSCFGVESPRYNQPIVSRDGSKRTIHFCK